MNLKIYKLVSNQTDDVYIGSTKLKYLSQRLAKHKNHFKDYKKGLHGYLSSFILCEYDDVSIELIEENSSLDREGYYIKITPECINHRIAGRSKQQYYEDNKEKTDAYVKKWHEEHKEQVKKHKDKYQAKTITCECGLVVRFSSRNRHMKSKKHIDRMNGVVKETLQQREEKYKARKREKIKCDRCDTIVSRSAMSRHIKNKH